MRLAVTGDADGFDALFQKVAAAVDGIETGFVQKISDAGQFFSGQIEFMDQLDA